MVCINDQKILSIKQRDPKSGVEFWSLPGGGIEPTETAREAAVRETREETGYLVVSKSESFTNEYEFLWNGQTLIAELTGSREAWPHKNQLRCFQRRILWLASGFLGQTAEMTLIITSH